MRTSFACGCVISAFAAVLGCGSSGGDIQGGRDGGRADGAPTDGAVHDAEAMKDARGSDGAHDADAASMYQCSSDLQSVVTSTGMLVEKCPADEGCAGGKCVAACAAAAAAKGTIGCDFVVATPSFYPGIAPPCWAVFVSNTWGKAITIEVSRNGTSYDPTMIGLIPQAGVPTTGWSSIPSTGVPPGDVGILFMDQDPSSNNETSLTCATLANDSAITPAVNTAGGSAVYTGSASASGLGYAWHIVTSLPVTMYDMLPYGGASSYLPSAELLIPTTAWATEFYGIVPYRGNGDSTGDPAPQWGQIVASEDGTTVNIVPNVALPGGDAGAGPVAPAPSGSMTSYTLQAGQYVQWQDSEEMSGTVITSNKPIAFSGGLGYDCYTSVTSTGGGCDSAHQQIPPVTAMGHDYVAPPFATRMASLAPESIPYRIVGVANGTTLTYDPPGLMSTVGTAFSQPPTTLSAGQVVEFETTVAFRVTSQDANHPFYLGQIMPGCMVTGGSRPGCSAQYTSDCCLGDEEFVNILPPIQFLQRYIFFTDLTYATTNLVFTRTKTATGFQDVTLDCAGVLTGWQPVGTEGLYETTNIDLLRGTLTDGGTAMNGTCNNGPHTATSDGPFGLMVWGLDYYASYAYPAGGNVTLTNNVVVMANPDM
jgi:hypothetical protein